MATQLHAGYERRGYLGAFLVSLGFVALFADLSVLMQPLEQPVRRLQEGLFSLAPALGLSFLNAAREIVFQQLDYYSLVSRILVLFTAVVAIVIGTVVLSRRSAGAAVGERSFTISAEGDR